MAFSKKRLAGIVALASAVTYAVYRRRGAGKTEKDLADEGVETA